MIFLRRPGGPFLAYPVFLQNWLVIFSTMAARKFSCQKQKVDLNHRPLGYEPKGSILSPVDSVALPRIRTRKEHANT